MPKFSAEALDFAVALQAKLELEIQFGKKCTISYLILTCKIYKKNIIIYLKCNGKIEEGLSPKR